MPDDDTMLAQGTVDFRNEGRRRDDSGQLFTVPPTLTTRQQYVYDHLQTGPAHPRHIGPLLHQWQGCDHCQPDAPCQYAESSGREVLEALRRKGLVRRDRHHVYRVASTSSIAADEPVDWKGF